jgi:GNAT superfamily N-acetyltransferase
MPGVQSVRFRVAGAADAKAIAALHADSWRRHYRGVYSDSFLDGDIGEDRLRVWSERLAVATSETAHTVVAEDDDGLVGFTHVVFDADPEWGALLDNLHVRYASKRQGVGSELMARSGQAAFDRGAALYLWVLEENVNARAFYAARGGVCVERAVVDPPGGVHDRLTGEHHKLRIAWTNPGVLPRTPQTCSK